MRIIRLEQDVHLSDPNSQVKRGYDYYDDQHRDQAHLNVNEWIVVATEDPTIRIELVEFTGLKLNPIPIEITFINEKDFKDIHLLDNSFLPRCLLLYLSTTTPLKGG